MTSSEQPALVQRLADAVPGWGAHVAYGEPVSVDGHEIVPVAIATFGFGAGEGSGAMPADGEAPIAGTGEGSGGGGGGLALPVGAYVARGGEVRFEANPVAVLVAATPIVAAVAAAAAGAVATICAVRAIAAALGR